MPNADDTKPIDLDAIESLLLKSEQATAFAVAILGPGSNEPADSLMAAVRALLAEVRRVTTERDEIFGESLVACAILGADPTAPDYDYLETLRAVVKERKDAVDAFHRCRIERDAAIIVVDRLLTDPALLSLAIEIGALDPVAIVAEPGS